MSQRRARYLASGPERTDQFVDSLTATMSRMSWHKFCFSAMKRTLAMGVSLAEELLWGREE